MQNRIIQMKCKLLTKQSRK